MKEIKHPYKEYELTQLWELIDKAINDLVKNQDIELTTRKEYIIGYLCKTIKSGIINSGSNDASVASKDESPDAG